MGSLVATDFNAAMVDLGSERVPAADWHRADASDHPFGPSTFDEVVCQFGVMFFPDRPAAFAQVRRVLAEDGVFRFNTWGPIETHDFGAAVAIGLQRAFPDDPPAFVAAVPHGYSDADRIEGDLAAGGLLVDDIETVTLAGHAASAADVAVGFCTGTPIRAEIEARGDLEAVTELVVEAMVERLGDGPVMGHMTAYVVAASPAD
jgi:SAM-dependent methyltransferase